MGSELKIPQLIKKTVSQITGTSPVVIHGYDVEARVCNILVANNEASAATIKLFSKINAVSNLIQSFLIPASAGSDDETPPVDLVSLCLLASKDSSGNSLFNTQSGEELLIQFAGAESCDLHVSVSAELFDAAVAVSDANAVEGDVLSGKTFYAGSIAKKSGSMPNRGEVDTDITTKAQVVPIAAGYHNGDGSVQISAAEQAKIIAGNIKSGITILGVEGDLAISNLLAIAVPFKENDDKIEFSVITNSAGTITSISSGGKFDIDGIKINNVAANIPLVLVENDVLAITGLASDDGIMIMEGTHE